MGSHYGRLIAATQPESSRQISRDRQEITLTGIQAMRIRVPEGKRYLFFEGWFHHSSALDVLIIDWDVSRARRVTPLQFLCTFSRSGDP